MSRCCRKPIEGEVCINAALSASESLVTRREQAIEDAILSGQNIEAVVRRENAIEQAQHEFKRRMFDLASR